MKNRIKIRLFALLMAVAVIGSLYANRIRCVKETFIGDALEQTGEARQAGQVGQEVLDGENLPADKGDYPGDGEGQPAEVKISGLKTEYTKTPKSTIQDDVRVTPGGEQTISLQMYQKSQGEWEEKASFAADEDGKVTLVYPGDWKETSTSFWRVVVDAGGDGSGYTSETVQVTTRNREKIRLKSKSAIIMEVETGQIFYGKSMDTRRANASTTKIMTALLALENKKLNSRVKITKEAVNTSYSHLGLGAVNDRVSMKHMLYMAMLPSDNGAAAALAIHTGGSQKAFIRMMNKKAKELGCVNTSFKSPHGLDAKNHYSTARDLALITRHAMGNQTFCKIAGTKSHKFKTEKKHLKYKVNSTNALLGSVKGVCGVKTGFTNNAGFCFAGAYKYRGNTYITVVLGAKSSQQRWDDTKQLIRYIKKYI